MPTGHPAPDHPGTTSNRLRRWLYPRLGHALERMLLPLLALLLAAPVAAQPSLARVGDPAPAFTLTAIDGRRISLSDFKGKYVVLEWWNSDCYAVNTHYGAGAMQAAQARARSDGVVWLSIDSTHPGHPSFVDAKRSAAMLREWKGNQHAMLQDPDGRTGRAYGAMMTPHTYVIDPTGKLIYSGAIDDQRAMRDVRKARNLPLAAIDEARAGKPVSRPLTQAYG
jgi:peroxiredoxin